MSFLLIFYVLALTFTIIFIALIGNYILDNDYLPTWISNGIGIPLMVFVVVGMFITFIDFLSQGWLKKKKWISKIYFPIYWIFSYITLSFLYRPIVYNFLDNKFGRRLSFLLIPLFIILFIGLSLKYNYSNYFSENIISNDYLMNNHNYEDMLDEKLEEIDDVVIQSKVITDPYLKVFVAYSDNIEDRIFHYNPGLKPEKDIRGLTSDIKINSEWIDAKQRDSLRREYLGTFNSIYFTQIDTIKFDSDFIISKSKKGTLGFETYLKTSDLMEGKHIFKLRRYRVVKSDTTILTIAKIPFWYFNQKTNPQETPEGMLTK